MPEPMLSYSNRIYDLSLMSLANVNVALHFLQSIISTVHIWHLRERIWHLRLPLRQQLVPLRQLMSVPML
jgi:hypothetical protein